MGTAAAPTVTIDQAPTQVDPATSQPILFAVVFSDGVTGFSSADVSFTGSTVGGTPMASVSGSGTTYTVAVSGITAVGQLVVSIPAGAASGAGGSSLASTSTDNTVQVIQVPPITTTTTTTTSTTSTTSSTIPASTSTTSGALGTGDARGLPATGSDVAVPLAMALLVVAIGSSLVILARRRLRTP